MATTQLSSFGSYDPVQSDHLMSDVVMQFKKSNVMLPLVWSQVAPSGAASVTFVEMTALASSAVDAKNETQEQTSDAVATTAKEALVAQYVIRADISDLARAGSAYDLVGGVSTNLGQACALKVDALCTAIFTGFSQTAGTAAGSALDLDEFFEAARLLHAAGAPMPYSYVGNSKQIWGSKGIQGLIVGLGSGHLADNPVSATMLANGYVGQLAGVNLYFSEEIAVDGNDDAPAGMFSEKAIGLGISSLGLIGLETQRDASYRHTEYIATVSAAAVEVVDKFGVYMLTDLA